MSKLDKMFKNLNKRNDIIKKKNTPKDKKTKPVTFIITQTGTYANIKDLKEVSNSCDYIKKLEKYFSISFKNIMGYLITMKSYEYSSCCLKINIPRFGLFNYDSSSSLTVNIVNALHLPNTTKTKIPFKWRGSYMGNQKIVVDHIMKKYFNYDNVNKGNAGVILNLEAGQGKSFVSQKIIDLLQQKTLIVVHNRTILFQWIKILKELFPDNKIGQYYGVKKEDGDIVVAVINSLLLNTITYTYELNKCDITNLYISNKIPVKDRNVYKPDIFFSQFGFVIFDECHEYCSTERRVIFNKTQCRYMLGLSATPDERKHGVDRIVHWNLGQVLDASQIDGYSVENIPFTGRVHMVKYYGPERYTKVITTKTLEMTSVPLMINQLVLDPYRMFLIIKYIVKFRKKNHNIFIFADRRVFLMDIKNNLDNFNICTMVIDNDKDYNKYLDDNKSSRLVGGSTDNDVSTAEEDCNIILTTYSFMGTGKSIPKMDAIILTTPRRGKSKQYINRIFRIGSDYSIERQIADLVDWSTPMKSQWYSRKKYYTEKKYPIVIDIQKYKDLKVEMEKVNFTPVFDISTSIDNDEYKHDNITINQDSIKNSLYILEQLLLLKDS